jgi:hypothetical protein
MILHGKHYINIAPQIPPPIIKYMPAIINNILAVPGFVLSLLNPIINKIIAGIWQIR